MKKGFRIILIAAIIISAVSVTFLLIDSGTKCRFLYGKNICNFYEMAGTEAREENFGKMLALCGDMEEVPKKDSCFHLLSQIFAGINTGLAVEACNNIKGYGSITVESCVQSLPAPFRNPGDSCTMDTECKTPMDYLIRSVCPYGSICLDGVCSVACQLYYDPHAEPPACGKDDECNCSAYIPENLKSCACHEGKCYAVVA